MTDFAPSTLGKLHYALETEGPWTKSIDQMLAPLVEAWEGRDDVLFFEIWIRAGVWDLNSRSKVITQSYLRPLWALRNIAHAQITVGRTSGGMVSMSTPPMLQYTTPWKRWFYALRQSMELKG